VQVEGLCMVFKRELEDHPLTGQKKKNSSLSFSLIRWKVKMNSIMNHTGKRAAKVGNSCGALGTISFYHLILPCFS